MDAATAEPGVRPFDMTGRPMRGIVVIDSAELDDTALDRWIGQAQEKMAADPPCPMPYVQRGLYGKAKALKGFYGEADWVPHYEYAWLDR